MKHMNTWGKEEAHCVEVVFILIAQFSPTWVWQTRQTICRLTKLPLSTKDNHRWAGIFQRITDAEI